MTFQIEYDNQNLRVEAESAVQAIIMVMDFISNITNKMDFNIIELQWNY